MKFADQVKDQKVIVFGLGLQGGGLGDSRWLFDHGAKVRVLDQKSAEVLKDALQSLPKEIEVSLGDHKQEDIEWADIIIKNPGVPDNHPLLLLAQSKGIPVLTSIAVFVREAREKVIGITGTRGKSTTTELIYQVLNNEFPGEIIRGGNIPGTSGLALLDQLTKAKYAVLELSSFQLHNFHELQVSPHIAVLTNLYPDHLNRYPNMDAYQKDKEALVAYQSSSDFTVTNDGNEGALRIASASTGKVIKYQASDIPSDWQIPIPGQHNRENIAATLAVAKLLNIKEEQVKKTVESFHGLPFRLENIGVKHGITYINDTTASTPVAAAIAVKALTTPTCIILGGQTKELPYDVFIETLVNSSQIKHIVVLGGKELKEFLSELYAKCGDRVVGQVFSMQEAVELATKYAMPNGTVLLSPGFTSFDLFPNEFDRGRQFNEAVNRL